jgi:dUTP pyrophosphatase
MKIKIKKIRENAILPQYQTELAAGFDFCAAIDKSVVIKPGEIKDFPTGIAVELPAGYELQIRSRSGLAYKHRVTMFNGVGTIDADYRGEMKVSLINFSDENFEITPGMRIAQGIVAKHEIAEWEEVGSLNETSRGTGGFGSTGSA